MVVFWANVKKSIIGFKLNFDANVKRTTARHKCENPLKLGYNFNIVRDTWGLKRVTPPPPSLSGGMLR